MKRIPLALLLITSSLSMGCVVFPTFPKNSARGTSIPRSKVDFIVPGVTTRSNLTEQLGHEFRECHKPSALAYSWENAGMGLGVVIVSTGMGAANTEWSTWHALFIALDTNNVVTRKQFVKLSSGKSLDTQLYTWAKRN